MTDFLQDFDADRDVDWILDEVEATERNKPQVIEGHASLVGEPSWYRSLDSYYHQTCGYLWRLHNVTNVGPPEHWKGPFGCPPENVARAAFGDQ